MAKKGHKVKSESARLFKSLVENGIDFLKSSVAEIQKSPKYSVINFCSAVELFLKAKLLQEHWSLILSNPERADLAKFKAGDFVSVAMEEAIRRLESVCNERVSSEAKEAFKVTRKHRNSLVHFVHPAYAKASRRSLETIVQQVCRAWFYLHQLLTVQWRRDFKSFDAEITRLDRSMHALRHFLRAKFQALQSAIKSKTASGAIFQKCVVCKFKAARIEEINGPIHESSCMVCRDERRFLIIDCPNCNRRVRIDDMGEGQCRKCKYKIDIDELVDMFGDSSGPQDPSTVAYCSECSRTDTPTAIPWGDDGYLCLSCLTEHERADNCGFCNELCTGIDPVEASLFGCLICEGSIALDHT